MDKIVNLDSIVRVAGDSAIPIPGEEKLITIDRHTGKAIQKTFLVRIGSSFQDYLVANNRNAAHNVTTSALVHSVRDNVNRRTLAIEIALIDIHCPEGNEAKVAESFHGPQAPGQLFVSLFERWVREFIPFGEESQFIEAYDADRHRLESHIAERAASQTGLHLTARVSVTGEDTVQPEIIIGPIEISVRLQDYTQEQKITVEAGLAVDPHEYVKAFVVYDKLDSAEELFKRHLKEYFFQTVTFEQFRRTVDLPAFKQPLLKYLSHAVKRVGRTVRFINFSTTPSEAQKRVVEFVAVNHNHEHVIPGRPQPVVIQNTVQLYCKEPVAFIASPITDLEAWAKQTLNVTLKRHLIGKTYVDLLLRFAEIEQQVKRDVTLAAAGVGYRVDHLVSVPNLKQEEESLRNPFLLDAEATFETSLDKFEVELKFHIRLCLPRLDSIEKYLNPGSDVKEAIKETVLREAGYWLRKIHPERFYLYFNEENAGLSAGDGEDQRLPVRELLTRKILDSLTKEFNASVFDLTLRVGPSDLRERYYELCFAIRRFKVDLEPSDPHATEDLSLTGNFELRGVHSDENGWRRFSVLKLDLDSLQHQLETHLKSELKTYYQSQFMFQNQLGREQVFNLVKERAASYMRQEFGLVVHLTNLDRNTTKVEAEHRQFLIQLEKKKLESEKEEAMQLLTRLSDLRKQRLKELSIFPIDRNALQRIEENILILELELEKLSKSRFGTHAVAGVLEGQSPDEIPAIEDTQQTDQRMIGGKSKAQLAG
jgi:hypothetical protein